MESLISLLNPAHWADWFRESLFIIIALGGLEIHLELASRKELARQARALREQNKDQLDILDSIAISLSIKEK